MHSALHIAEIRHSVTEFCNQPSLAALASTSSAWTPFAFDVLYGRSMVISHALYPLIYVKPSKDLVRGCLLSFPTTIFNLSLEAIERFSRLYASRVRDITYLPPDVPYKEAEAQWIATLWCRLPPVWFPKLSTVQIIGRPKSPYFEQPCSSTILVVTRLLGSALRALHVSHSSCLAWIPNVQSSWPLLTNIGFCTPTFTAQEAWAQIIPKLPTLKIVDVYDMRDNEVGDNTGPVLSCLRSLPHLLALSLRTHDVTISPFMFFFELSSLHSLTRLSVDDGNGKYSKILTFESLEPLLQLKRLVDLSLKISTEIPLTDSDIDAMLLAWPQLNSLKLPRCRLLHVTIKTLVSIARHQCLRVVEINMQLTVSLTGDVPVLSQEGAAPRLESLALVQPNFDGVDLEALAIFVSAIVPKVRNITSIGYIGSKTETSTIKTQEFNKILASIHDRNRQGCE
ncbi:hypothetical protein DL96DRAFT_1822494 [Flagelloscypha sp. PMI_526]|nr:hypothetical protein DL96DRAFT_1822494 [Flagelloscypha sp. PMI_526]